MQKKHVVAYLLSTALGFVFLVSAYYFQKYEQVTKEAITQTAKQSLHQLAYSEREYTSVSGQLVSLVELLSHSSYLLDYAADPNSTNKRVVEGVWSSVAVNQKWFSQIRLLDTQGMERIRVNYRSNERRASPAHQLQDKSGRDYFTYAQTLEREQIGSFGIDLEIEHGQIIRPITPALRLITPIYIDNNRAGYLILNIDVWYLASLLNYSPDKRFSPEVVGEHGYYLAGESPHKLFGNLIPAHSQFNFSRQFPDTWKAMRKEKSGYLLENEHLISFNQISFSPSQKLFLVNNFAQEELEAILAPQREDLLQEASIVLLLALVLVIPASTMIVHYRRRNVESQLARAALSGMSAVVISDRQHRAMLMNDQFTQLTGMSVESVENRNVLKCLVGENRIDEQFSIFEQVAIGELWEGEITFQRSDTEAVVTAILRVQSVLKSSGKVNYYIDRKSVV